MAETIEKNLLYIIKLESESLSAKDSEDADGSEKPIKSLTI